MAYRYDRRLSLNYYSQRQVFTICAVLVVAFVSFIYFHGRTPGPIPKSVRQNVQFAILYPGVDSEQYVASSSIKYDTGSKVLSYVYKQDGLTLAIGEQMTPPAFVDVPAAYTKLTDSMGTYNSFDSYYGRVALTKPKQFNFDQTAVFNSRGTLVFAHATSGSWSQGQWLEFINNMQVIR